MKRTSVNKDRLVAFFQTLQGELDSLAPRAPETVFAVKRLQERMRKRATLTGKGLREQAVSKFESANSYVKSFEWSLDPEIEANAKHFILTVLERYTSSLRPEFVQETLDLDSLFSLWRFGPGASNGVEGTHTVEKILEPMTCTNSSEPLLLKLRNGNPYFRHFDSLTRSTGTAKVDGSRLTTVPKNEEIDRTIAIEPSGSMCLQLAAGVYLEGALRRIGLDIRDQQPKNKALALKGSVDNSIATIDLTSASDLISVDLVRRLFPRDWYILLMSLRSPTTVLPGGKIVELNMISTMGNGFTFPLMTLVLVSLIYGVRAKHFDGPTLFIEWDKTAVFGDDIIVPVEQYALVCEAIESVGLLVNHEKSYSTGPFRESCGGDFYMGTEVTPFYVRSFTTDSQTYIVLNQVLEWCGRMKILLHQTIALVRSFLVGRPFFVPEWLGPETGIRVSQCPRRYKYLKPVIRKVRIRKDHPFLVPLACGGYISSAGNSTFYTPRPFKNEVRVTNGRLPKGYLNGRSPLDREASVSDFIDSYTFLLV